MYYLEDLADYYLQQTELDFATYFWRVQANDSCAAGEWSDIWNFTLVKYLSIYLIGGNTSFGTVEINTEHNTSASSPSPFMLENNGNCEANLSIKSTTLWSSTLAPLNTSYFMFKANYSTEPNSFNDTDSQMSWMNISDSYLPLIKHLNHADINDLGYIDISIRVPMDEPPLSTTSNITIYAEES